MARTTSLEKVALIEREGGTLPSRRRPLRRLRHGAGHRQRDVRGHYLDQFTHAERATDWRGNNNIAESIFEQMGHERHPVPTWVVVGAGTGGTSATIGRFVRYRGAVDQGRGRRPGELRVPHGVPGTLDRGASRGSRIEGIGRPRVEPSFLPTVVDRMIGIPDAASIAAMRYLQDRTGIRAGGSTGTNLYGSLADRVRDAGRRSARKHRHAHVRPARALCADLRRRRLARHHRVWISSRTSRSSTGPGRPGSGPAERAGQGETTLSSGRPSA